ncbi:DUF4158 domain-containing protein [Streptomyces sp. NPDC048637]|uniref:DUF4158 domain-containing protein n=1 Tax=Streptomyces sp. NPDC048637 TaxID=3155636 RepID=UPI00342DBA34
MGEVLLPGRRGRVAVQAKRRAHNRLTVAVQLTNVRYLGRFLPDLRQAPTEVARVSGGAMGDYGPVVSRALRRA